jgi:hypothetical protein
MEVRTLRMVARNYSYDAPLILLMTLPAARTIIPISIFYAVGHVKYHVFDVKLSICVLQLFHTRDTTFFFIWSMTKHVTICQIRSQISRFEKKSLRKTAM